MAQRIRHDEPGAWLHVMNRGVARRTIFERRADFRYFLACLARTARAGWIEIHAYSLLGTHFHLLVRSPRGEVWRGLRRAQNAYARRFNIQRRRDGPLFRGRFCSRRVRSERYWATVVRYIDHNAVSGRLAQHPGDWPFGSAYHYLRGRGPRWLVRSEVERYASGDARPLTVEAYTSAFGSPLDDLQRRLVDARLVAPTEPDSFDDLVGAAPPRVADWMKRKAALGDGTIPGIPVLCPAALERRLAACPDGPASEGTTASEERDWDALRAGLLRFCCGSTHLDVALRLGCSVSTAQNRLRQFRRLLETDHALSCVATEVLVSALRETWPDTAAPTASPLAPVRPGDAPLGDDTGR